MSLKPDSITHFVVTVVAKAQMVPICMGQNADKPAVLKKVEGYYGKLMPITYWQDPFGVTGLLRKAVFNVIGQFRPCYREASRSDMRAVMHKSTALLRSSALKRKRR